MARTIVVKEINECWFDPKTKRQTCSVLYEGENGKSFKGLLSFALNLESGKNKCDPKKDPLCFLKHVTP